MEYRLSVMGALLSRTGSMDKTDANTAIVEARSPATGSLGASQARLPPSEMGAVLCVATLILAASWLRWWPISLTEAFGFVTGAACVWLVVRENIWNWPLGLANNLFFLVLFFQSRLYADMGLQVVYFGLGVYGWFNWIYGAGPGTVLRITRTRRGEWIALALFIPLATWGLRELLIVVDGAAPFWDALTTVLCLCAQYLLCRKRFEHWFFWIAADLIYVPLYVSRDLPLTSVLYGVFLVLCLIGVRGWHLRYRSQPEEVRR